MISHRVSTMKRTRERAIKVRDVMVGKRFRMRKLVQFIYKTIEECKCGTMEQSEEVNENGNVLSCEKCKRQGEWRDNLEHQIMDMTESIHAMNKYIINCAIEVNQLEQMKKRKKGSDQGEGFQKNKYSSVDGGKEKVNVTGAEKEDALEDEDGHAVENMMEDDAYNGQKDVVGDLTPYLEKEERKQEENFVNHTIMEQAMQVVEDTLGDIMENAMIHVDDDVGRNVLEDNVECALADDVHRDGKEETQVMIGRVVDEVQDETEDALEDHVCDAVEDDHGNVVANSVDGNFENVFDHVVENAIASTVKGAVETTAEELVEDEMCESVGRYEEDVVEQALQNEEEEEREGCEEDIVLNAVTAFVNGGFQNALEDDVVNVMESVRDDVGYEQPSPSSDRRRALFERVKIYGRRAVRVARYYARWVGWKVSWKVTVYAVPRR